MLRLIYHQTVMAQGDKGTKALAAAETDARLISLESDGKETKEKLSSLEKSMQYIKDMLVAMKLSQELGSLEKGKKPPPDKPAKDFTSRSSGVGLSDDEYTLLKQKDREGKLKIFQDRSFQEENTGAIECFCPTDSTSSCWYKS